MRLKTVTLLAFVGLFVSCRQGEEVSQELQAVGYAMTVEDFHRATKLGEVKVMATMIEEGVDPFAEMNGQSALHLASEAEQVEAVEFLLDQGLSVDIVDQRGRTPILSSAEVDAAEAADVLIENGADLSWRDHLGYRAMTLAAENGSTAVVELIAKRSRSNVDDALFIAALRGHADVVNVLVSSGASVYARMDDGNTALMLAAREGHEHVVRTFLEYGANRYAVNADGFTAGQIAMTAGHIRLSDILLAAPGEEEFGFPDLGEMTGEDLIAMNIAGEGEGLVVEINESGEVNSGVIEVRNDLQFDSGMEKLETSLVMTQEDSVRTKPLTMKTYHERPMPMRVEGVEGKKVRVRFLYGEQEEVEVEEGQAIPFTPLRIASVQERRRQTKESGNKFADLSSVMVEDPRTGLQREFVTHLSTSAHDPFAVLESSDGSKKVAFQGAVIDGPSKEKFRVLDVRPTQVVLENLATGTVDTLHLAQRH